MLQLENLQVKYPDGYIAIQDLALHVEPGESVALMGANGAGKSSLLLAVLGIAPSTGHILIDGIPLEKKTLQKIRQKAGMVFQNPDDQVFMAKVIEDVSFGPKNSRQENPEAIAMAALEKLGIAHLAQRIPGKLSGGEKRLVALAGVLAMAPQIILFDEPTSFLDPAAKRRLLPVLDSLPVTKIIATHDFDVAKTLCQRILIIQKGHLVYDGDPSVLSDDQRLLAFGL